MRRKQNSLRSRGSGISISMRSNTVCVAQTDSAEAACVSHSSTTTRTRDLSVEWRNILKVYECLQLALSGHGRTAKIGSLAASKRACLLYTSDAADE